MARKPKPHIPQVGDELTAAWLTEKLAPRTGGAVVTDVSHELIGIGIGFVGDVIRCSLTWDRDDAALPPSVVAKVPSSVKANRALGEGLMAYEREIHVYRQLSGKLGIPMPEHLYSEADPNPAPWLAEVIRWLMEKLPLRGVTWLTNRLLDIPESMMRRFLLVMEDIHDARPAAQFDGGTPEEAGRALEVLAGFHAANWMDDRLMAEQPLIWPLDRTPKVFQAAYLRNRQEFVDRFGERVGADIVAHLDQVQLQVPELSSQLASPPWTLLHGDYRLDNILFRHSGEIVVLDYQLLLQGRAGWDVAYFITTALHPEHRAEEEQLLRTYHQSLEAAGVTDYGFAELVEDSRIAKELLAHRMVGTGELINTQVEGRDETFIDLMVHRVAGWVEL